MKLFIILFIITAIIISIPIIFCTVIWMFGRGDKYYEQKLKDMNGEKLEY